MHPVELHLAALDDSDLASCSLATTENPDELLAELASAEIIDLVPSAGESGGEVLWIHCRDNGGVPVSPWLVVPPGTRLPPHFDPQTKKEWRVQEVESLRTAAVSHSSLLATVPAARAWMERVEIDRQLTSIELALDIAAAKAGLPGFDWIENLSEPHIDLRVISGRIVGLGNPQDLTDRVMALLTRWPDAPQEIVVWDIDSAPVSRRAGRSDWYEFALT